MTYDVECTECGERELLDESTMRSWVREHDRQHSTTEQEQDR